MGRCPHSRSCTHTCFLRFSWSLGCCLGVQVVRLLAFLLFTADAFCSIIYNCLPQGFGVQYYVCLLQRYMMLHEAFTVELPSCILMRSFQTFEVTNLQMNVVLSRAFKPHFLCRFNKNITACACLLLVPAGASASEKITYRRRFAPFGAVFEGLLRWSHDDDEGGAAALACTVSGRTGGSKQEDLFCENEQNRLQERSTKQGLDVVPLSAAKSCLFFVHL